MKRTLIAVLFAAATVTARADNPQILLKSIATGLDHPVAIANAGDSRLFLSQQTGKVMIYNGSQVLPTPFLDLTSLVTFGGERGLLSIAFHPNYVSNGRFYVDYIDKSGGTVVASYRVSPTDPNRADPSSAQILLKVAQPFDNHKGGQLQFGPDGYLYIALGDGGSGGDPQNNGQDLSELLGKLLRIDVDGGSPYKIPSTNPFVNQSGARGEIWAYGLRNPWRFSFDRETGDLWIGDVGQNAWEEVDLQPRSSVGGENYGWRKMEGRHCFNPSNNCQDSTMTLPVLEYSHSDGCSISGGYRYRGVLYPRMKGIYFYTDYCSGNIWGASLQGDGTWLATRFLTLKVGMSTFGEDFRGELYAASVDQGILYQVTDTKPPPPHRRAVGK